jgi:hypothetical protein
MVTGRNPVTELWLRRYFPAERSRTMPHSRVFNIAFRTGHIMSFGMLVGGHFFGAPLEQLRWLLYGTILTGAGIGLLDFYMTPSFLFEGRGVALLLKLALLALVPILWNHRVAMLLVVIAVGSIGSHMPRTFRHYSFLYRKVLNG